MRQSKQSVPQAHTSKMRATDTGCQGHLLSIVAFSGALQTWSRRLYCWYHIISVRNQSINQSSREPPKWIKQGTCSLARSIYTEVNYPRREPPYPQTYLSFIHNIMLLLRAAILSFLDPAAAGSGIDAVLVDLFSDFPTS
jgi:hypothetical protein